MKVRWILSMLLLIFLCGCSVQQQQGVNDNLGKLNTAISKIQNLSTSNTQGSTALVSLIYELKKSEPNAAVLQENAEKLRQSLNTLEALDMNLVSDVLIKAKAAYEKRDTYVNNLVEVVAANPGITTAIAGGQLGGLIALGAWLFTLIRRKK